jgi:ACR3 family arsenite efflux pump ArsB
MRYIFDFIKKYSIILFLTILVLIFSYSIKCIYQLSYGVTFFIFIFLFAYMYTYLLKYFEQKVNK